MRTRIVDSIDQLERGQRVTVSRHSPSRHKGWQATVIDWDKYGGRYGIHEAVLVRFDDGCIEHRSPGSLLVKSEQVTCGELAPPAG